jgi:hypothetical protein
MEATPERRELPDVSAQQRTSVELAKRIRKLRWIGMEQEAERLQIALSSASPQDRVFAEPHDKD